MKREEKQSVESDLRHEGIPERGLRKPLQFHTTPLYSGDGLKDGSTAAQSYSEPVDLQPNARSTSYLHSRIRRPAQATANGWLLRTQAGETLCPVGMASREWISEELLWSKERFRLLTAGAKDYAIFMLDRYGYVRNWNLGAERVKGFRAKEIIGEHFSIIFPAEEIESGKPDLLLKTAESKGGAEDEGWRVRKDESQFWACTIVTPLRNEAGKVQGFAVLIRDVTERKRAEDSHAKLLGQLLQAQDDERRRLARELHDSTAQTLAALYIHLGVLKESLNGQLSPQASKALSESLALASQAADDVRDFSHLLQPPLLEEVGLDDAARWYVNKFVRGKTLSVEVKISPGLKGLPRDVEIALLRIMQESLANVHRHSGSLTAEIRLFRDKTQAVLEVIDRGKGLPPAIVEKIRATPAAFGVGIRGMLERVRQLGGRLEFGSANPGTIVQAILPLPKSNSPEEP